MTPADLFGRSAEHARSECLRHELAAEANAQRGAIMLYTLLQPINLVGKERKGLHVVDPNRAPEHDQEIGIADQGIVEVHSRCVTVGDGPPGLLEDRTHQTQVLERNMPYGNGVEIDCRDNHEVDHPATLSIPSAAPRNT